MSDDGPTQDTAEAPERARPEQAIRLLLSGGGLRSMAGSVGAALYLMVADEWKHVTEIVSVSGGSPPNAALLDGDDARYTGEPAKDDAIDLARLHGMYHRLVHDAAKPYRTWPRAGYALAISALLGALIASWFFAAGSFSQPVRPWLAVLAGVVFVPVLVQVGRRIGSWYFRDILDNVSSTKKGRLLSEAHVTARPGRQHVFCASGITSGDPYYFWAGGESFLGIPPGQDSGWGVSISPVAVPRYQVGDAVFASASLPMIGGVNSPSHDDDPAAGFFDISEPLVDGGASGVFGQQVRDPFWRPGTTQPSRTRALPWVAPSVIAVDSYRHQPKPTPGIKSWVAGLLRDRLSSLVLLVRWLKISGEAVYVNDLLDSQTTTLVRLCEFDLPAPAFDPSETAWRAAWGELCQLRQRDSDVQAAGVGDPLSDLRELTGKIGLFRFKEEKALTALTTGFVASYVAREPVFDPGELVKALKAGDKLFFARATEDTRTMSTLWAEKSGAYAPETSHVI